MTLVLTVHLSEYLPDDNDDDIVVSEFAWYKQHRFILTTDEDDPTDEVSYIAMLYAREAVKEWRRQHDYEAEFKRDIVRQLLREGGFGRRIEDKFAVGSLDMLLVTKRYTIYAEAKLLKGIAALPASVMQREQIRLVQRRRQSIRPRARYRPQGNEVGFGLPGERYDAHYRMPWPLLDQ